MWKGSLVVFRVELVDRVGSFALEVESTAFELETIAFESIEFGVEPVAFGVELFADEAEPLPPVVQYVVTVAEFLA